MTDRSTQTSDDEVPSPSQSHPLSHPNRLATLATLFGMRPAPVNHCRVLELGCADGGNLIPMAVESTDSEFVGIDLSARQIAASRTAVQSLQLRNIDIDQADILDVPDGWGPFDYIIAHDVYSWVRPEVREKILSICRKGLSPHGVAYVSHEAFPGSHPRRAVREMMRYHTRKIAEPETRAVQARALLDFLADSVVPERTGYRKLIKEEQHRLTQRRHSSMLHDELEGANCPVYFHEFAAQAARSGLQFLADADISTMMTHRLAPEVSARLSQMAPDFMAREQYLDFVNNRASRQTLLCLSDIPLRRDLDSDHVQKFQIASQAEFISPKPDIHSHSTEALRTPNGVSFSADHALTKAALYYLLEKWPQSVSFGELKSAAFARVAPGSADKSDRAETERDDRLLRASLLHAFTAGVVQLRVHAPRVVPAPSAYPVASPFARYQAKQSTRVTNGYHEMLELDNLSCHILQHLDGNHSHSDLVAILERLVERDRLVVQEYGKPVTVPQQITQALTRGLESQLRSLARFALLVG